MTRFFIFLGPPGSGKGTQSDLLSKSQDIAFLSTGDMLRAQVASGSKVGQKAKTVMEAGQLVSDDIILEIIKAAVAQTVAPIICFDGFPRTHGQATQLDALLNDLGRSVEKTVYFDVSKETVVSRILGRQVCTNCKRPFHKTLRPSQKPDICDSCQSPLMSRDDDTQEVVEKRFDVYMAETQPLLSFYGDRVITVDASRPAQAIVDDLQQVFS